MARINLYDRELSRFRDEIKRDPATAVRLFGFSLVHSLQPDERVQLMKALGKDPEVAEDFYNLGIGQARQGNWAEAAALFRKAVEKNPKFADAQYNLALSYERAGLNSQATQAWNAYADSLPAGTDKADFKKHASELGK